MEGGDGFKDVGGSALCFGGRLQTVEVACCVLWVLFSIQLELVFLAVIDKDRFMEVAKAKAEFSEVCGSCCSLNLVCLLVLKSCV